MTFAHLVGKEFIHHPDNLLWGQCSGNIVVIVERLSFFEMSAVHLRIANL